MKYFGDKAAPTQELDHVTVVKVGKKIHEVHRHLRWGYGGLEGCAVVLGD